MLNLWRCPDCCESHYSDAAVQTTAVYYPAEMKDGANVNPDRNLRTFKRHCLNCGADFDIEERSNA